MEQMTCFTYILLCSDGTLYCGWTKDLPKRVQSHNAGKGAKYTRCRLPVKILYFEELPDKKTAMQREYAIKQLSREQKLKLIAEHKEP